MTGISAETETRASEAAVHPRRRRGSQSRRKTPVASSIRRLPASGDTAALQWSSNPLRVGFVLVNNFTLSAFADFVDALRLAADDADHSRPIRCQWHVMSALDGPIRSSCGLYVCPTSRLLDPANLDYIIVVGGLLQQQSPLDKMTMEYLRRAGQTRVKLAGICTGSFVLCRLGLLDGKKCCISWFHYRDFLHEFDNLVPIADQLFVVDGNRLTCPGGAGVVFLAADLISRHLGASTAQKVLHMQQIDRMKPGSSIQPAPPFEESANDDDRISRALLLMEQNVARPVPISRIAATLGTSTRQLERLFGEVIGRAPRAAYLQLRLRHARWMLTSSLSLASIAADTGFSDGAHFGKAFKSVYGINPSEERRRLNQGPAAQVAIASNTGDDAIRIFDPRLFEMVTRTRRSARARADVP
jgi:transcriptional regulator GlxA family with amidase domain